MNTDRPSRPALGRMGLGTVVFLYAALVSASDARPPFEARVVGITDGDSIVVLASHNEQMTIRLDGIDCPEIGQDFGRRAKQFTSDLLLNQKVVVDPRSLDRYGRTVARVSLAGRDASVELVKAGYAWHFLRYSSDGVLAEAEQSARAARRGLWQQSGPVAPWAFRAGDVPVDAGAAPFVGNTHSRVFHRVGCRNHACINCTQQFNTRDAAVGAGYRPAGCCNP